MAQSVGSDAHVSAPLEPGDFTVVWSAEGIPSGAGVSASVSAMEPGATPHPGGFVSQAGTHAGRLGAALPRLPDGSPYQSWTLHDAAGDQVTVTMASDSFPAHLLLLRGGPTSGRLLDEATSDGNDGRARIVATLNSGGPYTVVATAGVTEASGPYEIQFERRPGPEPYFFDNASRSNGRFALLVEGKDDSGAAYRDVLAVRDLLRTRFGFEEQAVQAVRR